MFTGNLFLVALFAVSFLSRDKAHACSCVSEPNFYKQAVDADELAKIRIISEVSVNADGDILGVIEDGRQFPGADGRRHFTGVISRSFQGCLRAKEEIIIETCANQLCCGVNLRPGLTYMLQTLPAFGPTINDTLTRRVDFCGINTPWNEMTRTQKMWMRNSPKTCGIVTRCINGEDYSTASCSTTPCEEESSCDVPASSCRRNPCRKCGVEWYDRDSVFISSCSADPVMRTPVSSMKDVPIQVR